LRISSTSLRLVLPVMALALAWALLPLQAAPPGSALLNKPAPPLSRTTLANEPLELGALRGHVVLLNFWATWCAGCQIEMPRFVAWQQQYAGEGLSIIGVSMDDDADTVKAFLRKRKLNYPIVMGDEKLGLQYGGVLGLPVTFLIDRQGVVRARYQGEKDLEAMEARLRELLASR
jgi:cytochrome c biogenesis protein CcmG/thiol:disulfide interchange protein DsbE